MLYYQKDKNCVGFPRYRFSLQTLSLSQYESLKTWLKQFGEERNPADCPVLYLKNPLFFLHFPAYGFPYFFATFYPQATPEQITTYLQMINQYLTTLNNADCSISSKNTEKQ